MTSLIRLKTRWGGVRLGAVTFLLFLMWTQPCLAAGGRITGKVTDAKTGEALLGAHVSIQGTAIGASTNVNGDYIIPSVPPGAHTVVFSYLGYKKVTVPVRVVADTTIQLNSRMQFDVVQMGEVTVTAQLEGQAAAINQQLTSNTIVNIVTSDRIKELPDQNAAESIGRLPGISVQRDAGEGQKVVVRGLSPKFNSITVNGERVPSTDPTDRSVDLSMISPDVLSGIEVFKALTPDKDGDAIGGTVNLVLRHAPAGFRGDFRGQTGYNHMRQEYGQYRASLTLSDRFLDNALGVLLTGNTQRANRSSDELSADYIFKREAAGAETQSTIEIDNLNLTYNSEVRTRTGGGVTLDYEMENGDLFLSSFFSQTERDRVRRRKRYRVGSGTTEYDLAEQEQTTQLFTNGLSGRHEFDLIEMDWRLGYSKSTQKQPYYNYARFVEVAAFMNGLVDTQGPSVIPSYAKNDTSATWFQYGTFNPENVTDKDASGQLNGKTPFRLGEDIAGSLKFGGRYRGKERTRDVTEYRTPFGEIDKIGKAEPGKFAMYRGQSVLISNFADPSFKPENFLDGRYALNIGLDPARLAGFHTDYISHYDLNRFTELQDYEAGEDILAAYLMAEVNIGDQFTLLPGFRYERTKTEYTGRWGYLQGNLGEVGTVSDTTGGQNYGDVLPMLHFRYRVTPWFDIRLAYTHSLSRPDYYNLVPYEQVNFAEQTLVRGNPDIQRTRATNYDIYVSFYSNDLGLLTLGAYYKKLTDIDYIKQSRVIGGQFNAFVLTEPVNGDDSDVWGLEIDVQTNLKNLPSPFDGFVINANYSYIRSETYFPFFEIGPRSPDPPYSPQIIDTFRRARSPARRTTSGMSRSGTKRAGSRDAFR